MWTISRVICGIFLGILSLIDIRHHSVPLWTLAAGEICMLLGRAAEGGSFFLCSGTGGQDILLAAAGGAVGGLFFLVSRVTREALGCGDSFVIMILGLFLGIWDVLYLLMLAFWMAALFAAAQIMIKRFSRKTAFPFIPFLALAYVGVMML